MSHVNSLAREAALRALYQIDLHNADDVDSVQKFIDQSLVEVDWDGVASETGVRSYTRKLTVGVLGHKDEIDAKISAVARNWEIGRMAVIDRNVIRIGAFEMLWNESIPRKVAINEAIELVKKYSSLESGTFVNGILDQIDRTE